MKKAILLLLSLSLVLSLAACGSTGTSAASDIDTDLTVLSSTMVYSEVYNMMVNPDDYRGQTVRMTGQMAKYEDESTGNVYYACIVADATACCQQGIEFVLGDGSAYPEIGDEITVTGTFGTYDEGEYTYCQLSNAYLG